MYIYLDYSDNYDSDYKNEGEYGYGEGYEYDYHQPQTKYDRYSMYDDNGVIQKNFVLIIIGVSICCITCISMIVCMPIGWAVGYTASKALFQNDVELC